MAQGIECTSWRNSCSLKFLKDLYEPQHEISNNVVYATSKASDQPAHTPKMYKFLVEKYTFSIFAYDFFQGQI